MSLGRVVDSVLDVWIASVEKNNNKKMSGKDNVHYEDRSSKKQSNYDRRKL